MYPKWKVICRASLMLELVISDLTYFDGDLSEEARRLREVGLVLSGAWRELERAERSDAPAPTPEDCLPF